MDLRSSSSSLSRRKVRSSLSDGEKKSAGHSKHKSKKLAACLKKCVIFSGKAIYRSICDHPFLYIMVLFVVFLYGFLPSVFWFLVSSSPVIICTALILGTLLSFGQPHIPEVEVEEMKMVDDVVVQKKENYVVVESSSSESDSEEEDVVHVHPNEAGEPSKRAVFLGFEQVIESGLGGSRDARFMGFEQVIESGLGGSRDASDIVGDILVRRQLSGTSDHIKEIEITGADTVEYASRGLERSQESDKGTGVELNNYEPEPGSCYYTLLKPSDENDVHSDFASDRSESCSPDASISDINPMLDELCPFIPTNHTDDVVLESFAPPVNADIDNTDSESELSTQPHGSDYGSDEEGETLETSQEEKHGSGVAWTEDDVKNVMDLGSSEIERNRRLENLMAKRRQRQNLSPEAEIYLDLRKEDTSAASERTSEVQVQLPSISTKRRNPFDDDSDYIRDLPPIPGSAPSILLQKPNPFDFLEKHFDGSESSTTVGQSEQHLEGFTLEASGSNGEGKQNADAASYFALETKTHGKYQRQLSELSYTKSRSVFKPEPLYPLPDQEYHRGLLEQDLNEESEFISFTKHDDASMIKIESGILNEDNRAAPVAPSLPSDEDEWRGAVDETGAKMQFDASEALDVCDFPDTHPPSVMVSSDDIHYERFTNLETNLNASGTTIERILSFGRGENSESPRPQSDETMESDSSTESERSSMSERSCEGMLPASHPSVDEPVVLPLELNVLPEIAEKIKASSELEEQLGSYAGAMSSEVAEVPRDAFSDASEDSDVVVERSVETTMAHDMKEVDEHILSELDVVGDFSVLNLPLDRDQVEQDSQLYEISDRQDNNLSLLEVSDERKVDEVKLEVEGSSSEEDKEITLQSSIEAEASSQEVESHAGSMDIEPASCEIEVCCDDNIDLASTQAEGSPCDDPVEINLLSSNEVEASYQEVDSHESPKGNSNLHEVLAKCLDDIDLALMHAEGSHSAIFQEDSCSDQVNHQSDLHEIKAGSLDELHEALGKSNTTQELILVSSEEHEVESSDLHEVEVRSLTELLEALEKQDMPPVSVAITSENDIEDQEIRSKDTTFVQSDELEDSSRDVSKLHEIGAGSFKDLHAAMFSPDISPGVSNNLVNLAEAEAEVLSSDDEVLVSKQQNVHLDAEIVPSSTREIQVQDTQEMSEIVASDSQGPCASNILDDLAKAEVQSSIDEVLMSKQQDVHSHTEIVPSGTREIQVQDKQEMSEIVASDIQASRVEGTNELSEIVSCDPRESGLEDTEEMSEMVSSDLRRSAEEDTKEISEIVSSSVLESGVADAEDTCQAGVQASLDQNIVVSDLHEIEAHTLEDLHQIREEMIANSEPTALPSAPIDGHFETVVSELHEVQARSLEHLHAELKKQDTDPELVLTPTLDLPREDTQQGVHLTPEQQHAEEDTEMSSPEGLHQVEAHVPMDVPSVMVDSSLCESEVCTVDATGLPSNDQVGEAESKLARATADHYAVEAHVQELDEANGQSLKLQAVVARLDADVVSDSEEKLEDVRILSLGDVEAEEHKELDADSEAKLEDMIISSVGDVEAEEHRELDADVVGDDEGKLEDTKIPSVGDVEAEEHKKLDANAVGDSKAKLEDTKISSLGNVEAEEDKSDADVMGDSKINLEDTKISSPGDVEAEQHKETRPGTEERVHELEAVASSNTTTTSSGVDPEMEKNGSA